MKPVTMAVVLILGLWYACLAVDAGSAPSLRLRDPWSTVFGGREVAFEVEIVTSDQEWEGRLGWSLSFGDRVVARREMAVRAKAGEPAVASLAMSIPEVKEGVILGGVLAVTLTDAAGATLDTASKALRVFHENPFADRGAWLKNLNILLFDPTGRTTALFEQAGIPHRLLRDYNLPANEPGLWLVGEGVSFDEYRGLAQTLFQAASLGRQVLCMAPASGSLAVPGLGSGQEEWPVSIRLSGPAVIAELDKRLDAKDWQDCGPINVRGLAMKDPGVMTVLDPGEETKGWAWVRMDYTGGGGVNFCGIPIVSAWECGPTPRYLLLRLLEKMEPRKEKEP
ncbi:MAG: hypothetical protein KJ726_03620 [Verrucomicrobia bacterium]|nr:hypothetical protein [Verrucomicrobiota bacterium]